MIIGIPKEIMHDEARVAATPETVGKFVKDGFEVMVEKTAGDGALYHDEDYAKEGAKMIEGPQEIFDKADMILKVKEPLFNEKLGKHEVEMMHAGQILITFIHPASPVNHEMVKKL
ncbi:MAG: NAD(P)(+) transhydrogenase (Re/Si-specific) subunit alpha, partial [Prevotella sp.]|nr:NAD(P)(+) transhydrogenase (Re/Si-specific) subunit alpha [Prevotella sp.]